jgi:NAD(P)-dependent dehydrogenase (short-subunit alcohol dehydrogenase family)
MATAVAETTALVTGAGSGLGEATARSLAEAGARVALLDVNADAVTALAEELGSGALAVAADVTSEDSVGEAIARAGDELGQIRLAVCCHGILRGAKVLGSRGPAPLADFQATVDVNLVGTFNVLRLVAAAMGENSPDEDGERGAILLTASIAAYEGQVGQTAYSASKGGLVGLVLPAARDLAQVGIRVLAIAPGTFDTPMLAGLPEEVRDALGKQIPFPSRLGRPQEFAALVRHAAENPLLNGTTIRLDGALRLPPR